jgi:hypothetical protein
MRARSGRLPAEGGYGFELKVGRRPFQLVPPRPTRERRYSGIRLAMISPIASRMASVLKVASKSPGFSKIP